MREESWDGIALRMSQGAVFVRGVCDRAEVVLGIARDSDAGDPDVRVVLDRAASRALITAIWTILPFVPTRAKPTTTPKRTRRTR